MSVKEVLLPDIGDFDAVDIIEILVAPGDTVARDDSLLTLESDKASMEIPAPFGGTVREVHVRIGDKVSEGSLLMTLENSQAGTKPPAARAQPASAPPAPVTPAVETKPAAPATTDAAEAAGDSAQLPGSVTPLAPPVPPERGAEQPRGKSHASPAIRQFARKLGVDLSQVAGSGPKNRVLKKDVESFVKAAMTRSGAAASVGIAVTEAPSIDFAKYGEIETLPLTRIQKLSGANLHRNWVTIPHVTQFDEADITGMEEFRRQQKDKVAKEGVRLTLLSFLMKAVVVALKEFPHFNASLDESGENLVIKKYFHIGIAVDTPNGLVVPVVRNVDQKGLFELARELGRISDKARDKKLSPEDMKGGTFSISSLGGLGGTAFTPIINAPEVAILGVSRSRIKPVYQDGEFEPRLILPLSLSYDHRVIDGADAARFTTKLSTVMSDIRHMLL